MKATLRAIVEGKEVGCFPLERDSLIVGRSDECDIKLFNSAISRRHLRIFRKKEGWFFEDLGSSGGTILNEQRVEPFKEYLLTPSDRILLPQVLLIFSEEKTELKAEKTIIISKEEGILLINGTKRDIFCPPFEVEKYLVQKRDNSIFLVSKGILRKRELKKPIKIKGKILIPPNGIYVKKDFSLKTLVFFLSFFLGFFLFFPSEKRGERVIEGKKNDIMEVGLDEKRIRKLIDEKDWKGVRAEIMVILSSGKNLPSINEYLRMTYEEEKNEEIFEVGKKLFEGGKIKEAKDRFSEIPTGSVYYGEAQRFLKEIEKVLSKEEKKIVRKDLPPYLSFYIKGDIASAIKEAKDPKLQIILSQLKRHLETKAPEGLSKAEIIDRKIDPSGKGKIAESIRRRKAEFHINKAREALQKGSVEEAVENAEIARKLSPSSEEVKKLYSEIHELGKALYEKAYFLMEANPRKSAEIFKRALPLLRGTDYEKKILDILKKMDGER